MSKIRNQNQTISPKKVKKKENNFKNEIKEEDE